MSNATDTTYTNIHSGRVITGTELKALAAEAGQGAAQRAANRGWDILEQARCAAEAEAAELGDWA